LPKLLQAKQAADLHTPGFNQRVAFEVIRNGFLDTHLPLVRARYKAQRDAMRDALDKHLPAGCRFDVPAGGMFFWVELPEGMDAVALLPKAVAAGMAFVPGAPFYCHAPRLNTLRLSFVTVVPTLIDQGVAALGRVLAGAMGARS
jgi:2-aminoadipate transaminase